MTVKPHPQTFFAFACDVFLLDTCLAAHYPLGLPLPHLENILACAPADLRNYVLWHAQGQRECCRLIARSILQDGGHEPADDDSTVDMITDLLVAYDASRATYAERPTEADIRAQVVFGTLAKAEGNRARAAALLNDGLPHGRGLDAVNAGHVRDAAWRFVRKNCGRLRGGPLEIQMIDVLDTAMAIRLLPVAYAWSEAKKCRPSQRSRKTTIFEDLKASGQLFRLLSLDGISDEALERPPSHRKGVTFRTEYLRFIDNELAKRRRRKNCVSGA